MLSFMLVARLATDTHSLTALCHSVTALELLLPQACSQGVLNIFLFFSGYVLVPGDPGRAVSNIWRGDACQAWRPGTPRCGVLITGSWRVTLCVLYGRHCFSM